jgi:hypothetical protein
VLLGINETPNASCFIIGAGIIQDYRLRSILGRRALETVRFGSARGAPKFIEGYCRGADSEEVVPAIAGHTL